MDMPDYAFVNAWEHTRRRLAGLEAMADPGTIRLLEALSVGEGWDCLEVGAGSGSIAQWLSQRVGMAGSVTAIDLDTRWLAGINAANLVVLERDILKDAL